MTPLRQVFHAGLVAVGLSIATPTLAQSLAPIGPPTAEDAAQAAAPAAVVAPAAAPVVAKPGKAPSWLAARPTPKPVASGHSSIPSLGRVLGLLLVVGSLGGAALYLKRRGPRDAKRAAMPRGISVVSSTRIGPKAHAVVVSVAGRMMVLGVTDSSVKRLAFIDDVDAQLESERDREPARRPIQQSSARSAALAVRAAAPAEPAQSRSFAELLKTAFTKREPEGGQDAASILAAETQDVVGGKPVTSNVRMLDVEGQAQGLIRRLGGPRP
jgi:flagellar biogenesis protein FliO